MKTDCSTDRYGTLYAPWLAGADSFAERFIRPGDRVLDLCGGTGVVAARARALGARSVALLDVNPRVIPSGGSIRVQAGDAHEIHKYFPPHSFDTIVCRQAFGYLDPGRLASSAAQALAPGGRLCFNNFRHPRWFWKRYEYRKNRYLELGWYLGRTVWHLQHRSGEGWDLTKFHWHKHDEIVSAMSPLFNVRVQRTEKTSYYTCIVKDI